MASRTLEVRITGVDAGGKEVLTGFAAEAEAVGRRMQKVGKKMSIGLTAPLVLAGKLAFDELSQSEAVAAQTNATLKSTGGVANVTAGQIANLANELSHKSGIDDEAIQSSENLLLTFKNVHNEVGRGNDIFNRATTAALDLSTAGFGDLSSTSKMLGKALNDPVAGMTALSRAGVTFSQDQKNTIAQMVATGDILGAQKLILKEVESQVGGSAAAYGDTLAGNVGKAREALMNMAGSILSTATPAFDVITSAAQEFAGFMQDLPAPVQGVVAAIGGILAVAGPTMYVVGGLARNFATLHELAPNFAEKLPAAGKMAAGALGVVGYALIGVQLNAEMAQQNLDNVKNAIKDLSTLKTGDLVNSFKSLTYVADFGDVASNGLELFRMVAEQSTGTAERLLEALRKSGQDTTGYKKALDDVARGQQQAKQDAEGHSQALREQGYAAATTAEQIQKVNSAINEGVNSQLGVQGAILNSQAALESYNKSVQDNGIDSLATQQAANGLQQSYVSVAEAIMKNADANRDGKVSSVEAQAATTQQVEALGMMASKLDPGSPLRVWLDAYINQLRTGVPATVHTDMQVAVDAAIANLQRYIDKFNALDPVQKAQYRAAVGLPPNPTRAGGGPAEGWTLVGEAGPELVNLPAGSYVHNAQTTAKMAADSSRGGSSGGGVTVVVQASSIIHDRDFEDMVTDAIVRARKMGVAV